MNVVCDGPYYQIVSSCLCLDWESEKRADRKGQILTSVMCEQWDTDVKSPSELAGDSEVQHRPRGLPADIPGGVWLVSDVHLDTLIIRGGGAGGAGRAQGGCEEGGGGEPHPQVHRGVRDWGRWHWPVLCLGDGGAGGEGGEGGAGRPKPGQELPVLWEQLQMWARHGGLVMVTSLSQREEERVSEQRTVSCQQRWEFVEWQHRGGGGEQRQGAGVQRG